jgi:hypothetical protein
MIGVEDAFSTYEYKDHFKILPIINEWHVDEKRIKGGIKVDPDFVYNSSNNTEWMTKEELRAWLIDNEEKLGEI